MDSINVSELVERLGSDEDAVRKMAVFKLQVNIGDPSFADVFILEGGLKKLRYLILHATGNTLAYSLTSFSRLLEVDKGWDAINQDLVERVVELVVTHPLVNILRGAMSILVYIVSHPSSPPTSSPQPDTFGLQALKPAMSVYPQFLEMLVSRLSSADHALCANALLLINSLMREAITNASENDWTTFIKRLQELGVVKAVYVLMQSTALQDLSHPLLEYQALTKVLLQKWRDIPVDISKSDHRRALKSIHLASNPGRVTTPVDDVDQGAKNLHNPEKWRRLGFESETPAWEFEDVGYLGMMDLTEYVKRQEDGFQKLLLEQSTKPAEQRCPISRASLMVTSILCEHFEVEKADVDDAKFQLSFESRSNFDRVFKPLLLQWSLLHAAGLQAFFRLWQVTGAETEDFMKIAELVRILLESVVGATTRVSNVHEVETEIQQFELARLRQLQMELLELTYEDQWGQHLGQIRDELAHEALQFVKEQRIRCLLAGAWFSHIDDHNGEEGAVTKQGLVSSKSNSRRYIKLAHNRRFLHYADFDVRGDAEPNLEGLHKKIDLTEVFVSSNVTKSSDPNSSTTTLKATEQSISSRMITILGYLPSNSRPASPRAHTPVGSIATKTPRKEVILLTLYPETHDLAVEWLDGLRMLLNQQPITDETEKLIAMVRDYGLKIRLLNVRFDDMALAGDAPEIPSREGLDDDYYYDMFGN
ncbi:ELMO/CED-12 family-domain-containing protein [Usnea florida]